MDAIHLILFLISNMGCRSGVGRSSLLDHAPIIKALEIDIWVQCKCNPLLLLYYFLLLIMIKIYIRIYIPVSSSSSSCWVCWLILIREYICERDRSGKDCPRERAFLWDSHRPCKDRNFCITVGGWGEKTDRQADHTELVSAPTFVAYNR